MVIVPASTYHEYSVMKSIHRGSKQLSKVDPTMIARSRSIRADADTGTLDSGVPLGYLFCVAYLIKLRPCVSHEVRGLVKICMRAIYYNFLEHFLAATRPNGSGRW